MGNHFETQRINNEKYQNELDLKLNDLYQEQIKLGEEEYKTKVSNLKIARLEKEIKELGNESYAISISMDVLNIEMSKFRGAEKVKEEKKIIEEFKNLREQMLRDLEPKFAQLLHQKEVFEKKQEERREEYQSTQRKERDALMKSRLNASNVVYNSHTVVCVDRSGSMEGDRWNQVLTSLILMQEIRKNR